MEEQAFTYVFIDESGDLGFKLGKGSSQLFCLVAIICNTADDIITTQKTVQDLKSKLGLKQGYEFHYNKESHKRRMTFCEAVAGCPFIIRAVVVNKSLVYEDSLLRKSSIYFRNFVTSMLLKHSLSSVSNAKVHIDGSMDRELKTHLRQQINRERKIIYNTKFTDSATDPMIQLADMVAGSIAHSYKTEKRNCGELRGVLLPKIHTVWEFGGDE